MSSRPDAFSALSLPPEAVVRATTNARRDGAFAGLTSGLLGAIIASRLKLNRNSSIVAGIVTGILSGYHFTQGFLAANMSRLQAEVAALQVKKDSVNRNSEVQEAWTQE